MLVRKARSLRNRRLLGTWLYKVAYRVALRARAQADRRTQAVHEPEAMAPAEDVERRELREVIDEEILRLPRRFRGPVVLCYLEGVSHEEAARRLGCPLGTVNSRLATARQRLRTRLSKRGLAPAGRSLAPRACRAWPRRRSRHRYCESPRRPRCERRTEARPRGLPGRRPLFLPKDSSER